MKEEPFKHTTKLNRQLVFDFIAVVEYSYARKWFNIVGAENTLFALLWNLPLAEAKEERKK